MGRDRGSGLELWQGPGTRTRMCEAGGAQWRRGTGEAGHRGGGAQWRRGTVEAEHSGGGAHWRQGEDFPLASLLRDHFLCVYLTTMVLLFFKILFSSSKFYFQKNVKGF